MINEGNKISRLCWISSHIELDENEAAVKAAVEVTEEGDSIDCAIPREDIKELIKKSCQQNW